MIGRMRIPALLLLVAATLWPQSSPKSIPPPGIPVPAAERARLQSAMARLEFAIDKVRGNPLLPDVLVFREAVRFAMQYDEFFKPDEIAAAHQLLQQAQER